VKQYKDRIAKWGLEKKIKTDEMEAMIRKQQERALIGKQSAFRVRKKPVASQKISRYMKEHCIPALAANEDMNVDGSMDIAGKIDFFASNFLLSVKQSDPRSNSQLPLKPSVVIRRRKWGRPLHVPLPVQRQARICILAPIYSLRSHMAARI
jgi:hypothetical protein